MKNTKLMMCAAAAILSTGLSTSLSTSLAAASSLATGGVHFVQNPADAPPPPVLSGVTPLSPIRQAKYQITVYKQTAHTEADGDSNSSSEIVCRGDGTLPVYDARPAQTPDSAGYSYRDGMMSRCPTTLGGNPVTVALDARVMIAKGAVGFSQYADHKGFSVSLYTYTDSMNPRSVSSLGSSETNTPDLGLAEIDGTLVSSSIVSHPAHANLVIENFFVVYQILDTP